MKNNTIGLVGPLIAVGVVLAFSQINRMSALGSQLDTSELDLEEALVEVHYGTRFDPVTVELGNCKIKITRLDDIICSRAPPTSIYKLVDTIDVSQTETFSSRRRGTDTERTSIKAEYKADRNRALEKTESLYKKFVAEQVDAAGDERPIYRITPFYETPAVSSLPAFKRFSSCDSSETINLYTQYHPIWVLPEKAELVAAKLNEWVAECSN